MSNQSSAIVQRLWNYCTVLRDDGLSYGDYVEQLTYLLFLKMDDERRKIGDPSTIPDAYSWASLAGRDGPDLENHYREILHELGQGSGLIPTIFRKAQNRIQDPAKLKRLVSLIDGENWSRLNVDVKADIYEGLLEKNAQDVKSGAGETVRRKLLQESDLHTILRLPTGIFYAQGVKANVLFFERKPGRERPWTEQVWFYDYRTNVHHTLKQNPLSRADLDEFVACY
jgi:type I restriction-modification system DNA methylase subunit